ncbi:MAG: 50S ribosomal protein L21 [Candidatus Schekmanbacteria bacterium]|nr:50S ribosomal protein L21 [Candidatus Schekmanbacteria bacterium]
MYAIIESGGKQHKVAPGQQIRVEKLPLEVGAVVTFDKVKLVNNDQRITANTADLSKVSVKGTVLEQGREKKILVFKSKKRKGYKRQYGHRQSYTAVKIESIGGVINNGS